MYGIKRLYYLLKGMAMMILSVLVVHVYQSLQLNEGVPTFFGDFLNIFVVIVLIGFGFLEFLLMGIKQQNIGKDINKEDSI